MKQKHLATIATYVFLCVVCLFSVFPFYFMIVGSTNLSVDIVKGRLFFGTHLIENFKTLASTVKLGNAFWNSMRNALANTVASLFVCSLAGYGFQIYRDKGKDTLMGLLLLSMMVPFAALMVPLFRMFSQARLLDTTAGFILPTISTAFLIFFFRQSAESFPMETVQAARVDGLGELGIFFRIFVPIMAPTFSAAAIVTFMSAWNNYLWPLIIMQSQESQTMPLLITGLTAGYTTDYGILMLSVTITTLPTLILFFTQQKRFVEGVLGSVK
ncbi:MAG: carbohydrate ABC transporter permease [Sphaerochaeta sp.]|jgi:lactose/L-arabinose transport system permease protein|uniref:carbohydrate ABC transporter permease n=1 Tax=unclassified Sphaerochaeta TaxID=2637943 RepID=UPI0025D55DB6|nr:MULTISPECIES: carbohydrate ABC transporter permease [unclassified Sphaerochaeta]MCK9597737.1 carbohydrate ABC transporter permease [Sphaerochaeta sp.]MDX9823819.1 carbohydrate ABC transporter permease [Sphaerochaeta sp.]